MNAPRLWLDVSFTRTQQGTIGITRTVRRLLTSPGLAGQQPQAVAFHADGFRRVEYPDHGSGRSAADRPLRGGKLFRWLNGGMVRSAVVWAVRWVPWPLLRVPWRMFARFTFNTLSESAPPVRFQPGDRLVIADVAWNYPVWQAVRKARAQGAMVLLLVYDLMPVRHPEFCFPLAPKVFRDFLLEMLQCSDAVLCISRATENDLRAWAAELRIRIPPTGFFYLGSDAVGRSQSGDVRPELQRFLAATPRCFAAVGSFEPKKNYEMLLRVFEGLWDRGESVRLLIAGKPTADCRRLIDRLAVHPERGRRLLILHDASDAEVAAIYSSCKALVFPSLFEGFGLPLVEARARGCRVIASDIPVFVELADEGVSLFRRDSLAALQAALLSPQDQAPLPTGTPSLTWTESALQFYRTAERLTQSA